MLRKKAFGPALIALLLSVFIAVLAACGSSSSGSSDDDPSSSSNVPMSQGQTDIIKGEPVFEAQVHGPSQQLRVTVEVETEYPATLDRIVFLWPNNSEIKSLNVSGQNSHTMSSENIYEFTGGDRCGQTFNVCMRVYADGKTAPQATKCAIVERQASFCQSSSSVALSSSSQQTLRQFSPVSFGGSDELTLNSATGNRGVVLSAGAGTASLTEADIYYEAPGMDPGDLVTGKANVRIVDRFMYPVGNSGSFHWDPTPDEDYGVISTPLNTSKFILHSTATTGATSTEFGSYKYYMVRTGDRPMEWVAGDDYLVLISVNAPSPVVQGNKSIKIKAWKVQ